jgi:hypothetical protein
MGKQVKGLKKNYQTNKEASGSGYVTAIVSETLGMQK